MTYVADWVRKAPALFAVTMICLSTACSPLAPLNFSVQNVDPSPKGIDADLRSITVVLAQPSERTGPLPADSNLAVEPWKEALTDAVNRSALFTDDSKTHVNISVEVLKVDISSFGINLPTSVDARYRVIDRSTGKSIFDRVVSSEEGTEFGYSAIGVVRGRELTNRAIKRNIIDFLQDIEGSGLMIGTNSGSAPGVPGS